MLAGSSVSCWKEEVSWVFDGCSYIADIPDSLAHAAVLEE